MNLTKFPNHEFKIITTQNALNQNEFNDIFFNFISDRCLYDPTIPLFLIIDDIGEDTDYRLTQTVKYAERLYHSLEKFNISYVFVTNIRNNKSNLPFKNIHYIKGQSLMFYKTQFIRNNNINDNWNYHSNKGLFIPGKTNRYNRCGLMYKLYANNFLDSLSWSFIVSPKIKNDLKNNFFNTLTEEEFEQFIQKVSKTLDQPIHDGSFWWQDGDYICHPEPYDAKIFSDTSFSIISETYYDYGRTPTITEKTYRAIVNKHPFIISGAPETLKVLESYGYKTFREYCLNDYDEIIDEKERLQAVVENVLQFYTQLSKNIHGVQMAVEHNYNLFIASTQKEINDLENLIPKNANPKFSRKWYDYIGYGA